MLEKTCDSARCRLGGAFLEDQCNLTDELDLHVIARNVISHNTGCQICLNSFSITYFLFKHVACGGLVKMCISK